MATPALAHEAYEPDKVVADIEEPPFQPTLVELAAPVAFSRVPTEELIVHVRDETGHWHRRHAFKMRTACGRPWMVLGDENVRSGRYTHHPLADCECWTTEEWAEADEAEARSKLAVPEQFIK